MKKIIYITKIVALFLISSCMDDSTLPVKLEDLENSGVPFASDLSKDIDTNFNKFDFENSAFTKTFSIDSPDEGKDVTKVDIFVSLSRSIDILAEETFLKSYDTSSFSTDESFQTFDLNITASELFSTLNYDSNLLEGGEVFSYRLALTNNNGTYSDVSANFDGQSADHSFTSTVVCELEIIPEGDWVIDMQDSYGDGWQSTTADGGGSGITLELSDGTFYEIGLCTAWEDPGYDCTEGTSSGSRTITIPAGITSADWQFRGDHFGEISYQIYAPSGNLVASALAGSVAGTIALNLCNE